MSYREKLSGTRDFDLDDPHEEELKKAVEEKKEAEVEKDKALKEVKKLKSEAKKAKKKIKNNEEMLHRSMRQSEDALAEITRQQDEALAAMKTIDWVKPKLTSTTYENAYGKSEKKSRIPPEAFMIAFGFLVIGGFIWFLVHMTLAQNKRMEKERDTVDVPISYYETIKEWTTEIPELAEFVKELRKDDKITVNEYVAIRDKLYELRKEKVAREAMGDGG